MRFVSFLLGILCYAAVTHAQLVIEDCHHFAWDDRNDAGISEEFRIYASQTSGQYAFVRLPGGGLDPQKSQPTLRVVAIPGMLMEALCTDLAMMLTAEGQWFAVLTAVGNNRTEESDPSNEVSFIYRNQTSLSPIALPPGPPKSTPVNLPTAPPSRLPVPIPPVIHRDNAPFTQTELFQGVGRSLPAMKNPAPLPTPCQDPPGVAFTETCLFRGQR